MDQTSSSTSGKFVLLIGPSGVGKSVVLKRLKARHPDWHFPRSIVTRPRRVGEGDDLYHFVTNDQFDEYIKSNRVLEWATVHESARYGTLADDIVPFLKEGKIVVREVDVQGFKSIRSHSLFCSEYPLSLISIFILPESKDQLIAHIHKRGDMDPVELAHRLKSMEKEMEYAPLCDVQIVSKEGRLNDVMSEIERICTK